MRCAFGMSYRWASRAIVALWLMSVIASGSALAGFEGDNSNAAEPKLSDTPVAVGQAAVSATASENARDVLASVRPSIIQVKGFFGSNSEKAFHGTGFAVTGRGEFMTNYHVVSEHVLHPAKYRLEYLTVDGKTGPIKVLAVDVRHDLALVRAEGFAPAPLKLETKTPAKGERAYSVGFPLDVGLTITEGVSNGKVDASFDARIHYSGAINGGMSGGPALTNTGAVIGVNVSGYRFQQLVSFLVPAEHAIALRDRSMNGEATAAELKQDILLQLRTHSAELLAAFQGSLPTQATEGYSLPGKLAPFVDCSGSGVQSVDQPVQTIQINCRAKAGLYLEQGLSSGDLNYQHTILTTEKLGAWRFANKLSALTSIAGQHGTRKHVGPYACDNKVLSLKGFDASVNVCVRSYRKYEGLYDFTLRVSSMNRSQRGIASQLHMYGMEYGPGMAFIRRFVEAMESKS